MTEYKSITEALAAFQAELPSVAKGSVNPHFKSAYADLTDISTKVLPALAKHGLAWVTIPTLTENGFVLEYELRHTSGEKLTGSYPLGPAAAPPQQLGTAITYARRYSLVAVTGVAPGGDDDDAESAQAAHKPAPANVADLIRDATTVAELTAIYSQANAGGYLPDIRALLTQRKGEINASSNAAAAQ